MSEKTEKNNERALWNDAQVEHIMHFVDLSTAEIKRLREEVKQLREELNRVYDTIWEYEEVIEPKRLDKIERLEKALKSNGKYNAVVSATGNAGGGSIMVNVTFDDGEKYYGIVDKEMIE